MQKMSRIAFAVALVLLGSVRATAAEDPALESQLRAMAANYQGKVALFATDLRSGKSVSIDADAPVQTASVIKLAILFEALKQIQAHRAHFDDNLVMNKRDQVIGSGMLRLFDAPMRLTLKDVLTMMVVVSDNTAANLAIDRLGLQNIDNRIRWLGLQNTWLYKKVFQPATGPMPADQKLFGLGKTTAREMSQVMARFATCNLNAPGTESKPSAWDQKLCDVALGMLKNQFYGDGIPRYLEGVTVANKTGSLDDVRNDVGVVFAPNGPIVISAFTYDNKDRTWTPDNSAQLFMAKAAKAVVDAWR